MTIFFRPVGRGNWREIPWTIDSGHLLPIFVRIGDVLVLGELRMRVTRVEP